jgi:hypothetical protein
MITPETSAVVSQMRKRTTATERNRARDAINQIVKKVKRVTKVTKIDRLFLFNLLTFQLFNSPPQRPAPEARPHAFSRLHAEESRSICRLVRAAGKSDTST